MVSCHKKAIRDGFNYSPPGIPNDYTCIGDFVQGWKDESHNDGIRVRFCRKDYMNGNLIMTTKYWLTTMIHLFSRIARAKTRGQSPPCQHNLEIL